MAARIRHDSRFFGLGQDSRRRFLKKQKITGNGNEQKMFFQ